MQQFEADAEEPELPPWWKSEWFWSCVFPVILTAAFLIVGVIMVVHYKNTKVIYFEVSLHWLQWWCR